MATKTETNGTDVNVMNANIDSNLSVAEITAKLIENGAKMYQRKIKVAEADDAAISATGFEYYPFKLTLNEPIPAYINDGNDNWVESTGVLVFTTNVILAAILRENPDTAWVADKLSKNPKIMKSILSYAEITIVQQDGQAGTNYRNPYSKQRSDEVFTYSHNTKQNYIASVKLGEVGEEILKTTKAQVVAQVVAKLAEDLLA